MGNIFNINRPYVRIKAKHFTPIYVPGERYAFYINFDNPVSDISYQAPFQLYVINALTGAKVAYIPGLNYVFVEGVFGYHLYIQNFVFPLSVPDGEYYFQIWNTNPQLGNHGSSESCRSNLILVSSNCFEVTSYLEFRHNDEIFNFKYDLLPNFKNKFRLPINLIRAPEISSIREQYRQSSGQRELRNSKSFRDIKQTYEMYWSNSQDYEALSCVLEHSDVSINGMKLILLEQVKVEEISNFTYKFKGTFTVIVRENIIDVNSGNLSLMEEMYRGGNFNYICSEITFGST